MDRKYYEAYDDRYTQVHGQDLQWFDDSPSPVVGEILERYSYHRCLRTIFPNTDLEGNDAGFFLHIWGENLYISTGGTGEIVVNDHVYRMGLFGNQKLLAFMEELATVLAEAEPVETLS